MPASHRVKSTRPTPRLVGVIATPAELRLASRMSSPPDLFELRLDALFKEKNLERKAYDLPSPLIVTARHPAEGGKNDLGDAFRRELLFRFLPMARYVDIELRSLRTLRAVLVNARSAGAGVIISFHDFGSTPPLGSLRAKASRAARFKPALFKVASRTDSAAEMGRLVQLFSVVPARLSMAVMGMGRLGAISRLLLAQCGSALIYTSLTSPTVEGQMSLTQVRAALRQVSVTH